MTSLPFRPRNRRRYGTAAALFLLGSSCSHPSSADLPREESIAAPLQVSFVLAEARRLPDDLTVSGELRADAQIELCSEVEGRIVRADIERGQFVKEGEVLAEIDDTDARSRLAEAEAMQAQIEARLGTSVGADFDPEQTPDVRLARVNMERAETEAGRYARLLGDGAVARSLHDVEKANYEVAKERHASEVDRMRESFRALQAQKARVALSRKALQDTRVRAPWSGVVFESKVDAGQYLRKGEPVATLVRVDTLRVSLSIPEADVAAVKPDQPVRLEVRSRPDEEFTAVMAHVGPALDPVSRALTVEALVRNDEHRLQPGLFVTAHIELPASTPSVLVARSAVVTEAGVSHLFVVEGDTIRKRFVQPGREVGESIEILRGLAAGEKVVVPGSQRLADGVHVVAIAAGE